MDKAAPRLPRRAHHQREHTCVRAYRSGPAYLHGHENDHDAQANQGRNAQSVDQERQRDCRPITGLTGTRGTAPCQPRRGIGTAFFRSCGPRTDDLQGRRPQQVKVGAQVHHALRVVALHVDNLALPPSRRRGAREGRPARRAVVSGVDGWRRRVRGGGDPNAQAHTWVRLLRAATPSLRDFLKTADTSAARTWVRVPCTGPSHRLEMAPHSLGLGRFLTWAHPQTRGKRRGHVHACLC